MKLARVTSEKDLDTLEKPVRDAFTSFLAEAGLLGTEDDILGLTFRSGSVHFAAKALEFVPPDLTVLLIGSYLSEAEVGFLSSAGRRVFTFDQPFDNELVYEMLMDSTSGTFGWVDADCFVLNPAIWSELFAPMTGDTGSHAAFTYDPLGFAKTPLVVWSRNARELLRAEGTTLNSYSPEPTGIGRASPYAISRLLKDHHHRYLEQVLGVGPDHELRPHDGLLDIFDNLRTVNTRRRHLTEGWFGPDVRRIGWLIDTPMMAEIVLRAHSFKTKRVIVDNRQISHDIIHVGASSYRERMRQEGASTEYLARFRLTDLFEILLANEVTRQGLGQAYEELSDAQVKRLRDEAGIQPGEIKAIACSMLRDEGVDPAVLIDDPRFAFLFLSGYALSRRIMSSMPWLYIRQRRTAR